MTRIYLDHNATAPLHPAARAAIAAALDEPGNPSSLHAEGRRARDQVERARDQVAARIGGRREQLVFTSGGTEADNLGLRGLAALGAARGRRELVLSPIEHPAVADTAAQLGAQGFTVCLGRVDGAGRLDLEHLASLVGAGTAAVAVQLANHEIGVLQDVAQVAALARQAGAFVHCDAVQALGKVAVDVAALGADTVALSAHKVGGPKGAGALWTAEGIDLPLLMAGGHQERERRPGTENVLGIVGFGAAAAALEDVADLAALRALRDRFEAGARALGAVVHGAGAPRVPNTSNVAFDGVDGQLLMEALDIEGVAVSTGAACSSGTRAPSPVIRALGADARAAVRVSLGRGNDAAQVDRVLALLPTLLERIRRA